jgi:hypothetical protein
MIWQTHQHFWSYCRALNHAVEPRANAVRRFFLRQNAITESPETPYFSCVCATFLKAF